MEVRLETIAPKRFIGSKYQMSLHNNKTYELWRNFMPRLGEINHKVSDDLYSIEIYPTTYFAQFNPEADFEKWAAVEISANTTVPEGMQSINTPSGLYAVFIHRGPASEGHQTYQYIFQQWLPQSAYEVDSRPHFAIMGEKYKNEDPNSEEEIWVPIKPV